MNEEPLIEAELVQVDCRMPAAQIEPAAQHLHAAMEYWADCQLFPVLEEHPRGVRELMEIVDFEVEEDERLGGLRIVGFVGEWDHRQKNALELLSPYLAHGSHLLWAVSYIEGERLPSRRWVVNEGQLHDEELPD